MKNRPFFVLVAFFLAACQVMTPVSTGLSADSPAHSAKPVSIMAPLTVHNFGITPLKEWVEVPYTPQGDDLPVNLEMVENPAVTGGLTKEQVSLLSKNGFVVLHTEEAQFADIRDQVSEVYGQPYYVSTDAAFHALHINFDALLKQLEKTILKKEATAIVRSALDEVSRQANTHAVNGLDKEIQLAQEYLAVALVLFDENSEMPAELRKRIQPQVNQVIAASGRAKSTLIPDFEDDYGAYKPVGHYAGDPELESYFRGMTWAGRVAFKFSDIENPKFVPSRAPLIITRAMRLDSDAWARYIKFMETLSFIIGPTDDAGPLEVLALMDAVYGRDFTLDSLADDQAWQKFLARVDELPQPQINSTFANTTSTLKAERSWRLMGQRFTLDGLMFQNLIYDKVGSDDNKREFPSGLDVMAVMGSDAALDAQKAAGEDKYANYLSQVEKLEKYVKSQKQTEWLDTFYSGWLYAFLPQVQPKGGAYPPMTRTIAWQNRETNTALGSWAELKHDTSLYAKMPEFMGGGGPPSSAPAPGYVEANPNVFYRLAYISLALKEGLELRGYPPSMDDYTGSGGDLSYTDLWSGLGSLSKQFTGLGDIAVKELRGDEITEADRYLITEPLGALEDHVAFAKSTGQDMELPPVPVIAAVSGAQNDVLEVGVGYVDRIYVVVPINGKLQIAQGGVFTYYEFKQPRSNRLTDEDWRIKLDGSVPKLLPYTETYMKPGGKPVDTLAYRIGDVYKMTEAGANPPLNVRSKPSKSAPVLYKLGLETYFEIVDGPQKADNITWWKIKVFYTLEEQVGWVAENSLWYERAHGQ